MALVNHATREINAKIVYYGPERSGKATSLHYVHNRIRPSLRGELKSIPASGSPLLFFDFSPYEQPVFGGYRVRFHLYTLQGEVANPAAWKMTLKGADGLVIVMDAAPGRFQAAQRSLAQLRDFLDSYGMGLDDIPAVLQLNKADLSGQVVAQSVARGLGVGGFRAFPSNAVTGEGVLEVLSALSPLIMERIGEREELPRQPAVGATAPVEAPATAVLPGRGVVEGASAAGDGAEGEVASSPAALEVSLAPEGVRIESGTVLIPLEFTSSQGIQRLNLTVALAPAP